MTPNYVRNSSTEVSLWCTCDGSGNEWQACQRILHMFSSNTCLRKYERADMAAPFAYLTWNVGARTRSYCDYALFKIDLNPERLNAPEMEGDRCAETSETSEAVLTDVKYKSCVHSSALT